jgi:hypothetical protein
MINSSFACGYVDLVFPYVTVLRVFVAILHVVNKPNSTYPAGMTDNKCGINQSINHRPNSAAVITNLLSQLMQAVFSSAVA